MDAVVVLKILEEGLQGEGQVCWSTLLQRSLDVEFGACGELLPIELGIRRDVADGSRRAKQLEGKATGDLGEVKGVGRAGIEILKSAAAEPQVPVGKLNIVMRGNTLNSVLHWGV